MLFLQNLTGLVAVYELIWIFVGVYLPLTHLDLSVNTCLHWGITLGSQFAKESPQFDVFMLRHLNTLRVVNSCHQVPKDKVRKFSRLTGSFKQKLTKLALIYFKVFWCNELSVWSFFALLIMFWLIFADIVEKVGAKLGHVILDFMWIFVCENIELNKYVIFISFLSIQGQDQFKYFTFASCVIFVSLVYAVLGSLILILSRSHKSFQSFPSFLPILQN